MHPYKIQLIQELSQRNMRNITLVNRVLENQEIKADFVSEHTKFRFQEQRIHILLIRKKCIHSESRFGADFGLVE